VSRLCRAGVCSVSAKAQPQPPSIAAPAAVPLNGKCLSLGPSRWWSTLWAMAFSYRSFGRSTSTLTTTVLSTLLATLHCGGGVNEKPSPSSSPAVGTDDAGLTSPGLVSDPSASNGPGSDAITGAELPPTSDEPDPILID